ncbi:hypothetical protein [Glaciecola sp. KUL10]|uniref:hypothetical protein n=1 Tax=Glaciecola sp. (strain KUL10) TaxID=2161813 RepID=UPI000D785020|nr:hypothetical protein [Glaciecola sp. KUL10]GBL04181.1 hypothetical protein KUL10_14870 [Glaciecola sp. KUL10]
MRKNTFIKTSQFIISIASIALLSACTNEQQSEETTSTNMTYAEKVSAAIEKLDINTIEVTGFECANELLPSIHILGRGTNFPDFLTEDVSTEIIRQDYESIVKRISCLNEPTAEAKFVDAAVTNEAESGKALDAVTVNFPLGMVVYNGEEDWMMRVDFAYIVEGLVSAERPTVKKRFKVLETLESDGTPIKGIIKVAPAPNQ